MLKRRSSDRRTVSFDATERQDNHKSCSVKEYDMRIMTESYKDKEFFVPLNVTKTEGFWCKPLATSARRSVYQDVMKESGGDVVVAAHLESEKLLLMGLTRWIGMYDMGGKEIEFSEKAIKALCEFDPDMMTEFVRRVKNIARFADMEDEKN